MTDRYCVFGNPIAHSKSPAIHAAFARATGQDMSYVTMLAPLDGFAATLAEFRAGGGCGGNVTVPFKEQACQLSDVLSERARRAGAVNTLKFTPDGVYGDNTDGVGLLRDLTHNLRAELAGRRILLLGAGGAARGIVLPLLEHRPAALCVANRTALRAAALVEHFGDVAGTVPFAALELGGLAAAGQFDLVINSTASGLSGAALALPDSVFAPGALAYDMVYGRGDTPFLAQARAAGARCSDGLGMLVEQAAAAFDVWRGIHPDTAPVLAALRAAV
ncbi:MAG: shikimate dehydrogenase [Rhodocyclaceae bacterium]|nr:shikimate dehydrogenase [Rhodocyclaceae bacterium]